MYNSSFKSQRDVANIFDTFIALTKVTRPNVT
uniref:Uncharacterized protein n=1 Tax=Anguilla anguilla TaxID=7936 RepID=A0A0E9W7F8_ANGAN